MKLDPSYAQSFTMTAGLEINEQTIFESASADTLSCSDIISEIQDIIGMDQQWYSLTIRDNLMLSSDTDILLNCLASPLIA